MKKVRLFIDFDNTLFDRSAFIHDFFGLIKSFGVSDSEIEISYKAVYKNGYLGIKSHLEYINSHIRNINSQLVLEKYEEFMKNADRYLYGYTIPFLKSVSRDKYSIELLTVGGVDFQKKKVMCCGLDKYFDKCNYTTEEKAFALKELIDKDEYFILIDDKESERESVKKAFINSVVINPIKERMILIATDGIII